MLLCTNWGADTALTFQRACSVVWAAFIKVSKGGRSGPARETRMSAHGAGCGCARAPAVSTPLAGAAPGRRLCNQAQAGGRLPSEPAASPTGASQRRSGSSRLCLIQGVVTNISGSHVPGGSPRNTTQLLSQTEGSGSACLTPQLGPRSGQG